MTVTVASVLPLAMAAWLVCGTAAAPNPMLVDLSPWIRPLPSNVMHWTVLDVETWMNTTIGYPEYSSIVRLHQIDGPTLIGLNVKTAFEPSHPIHAVKLKAHINILRDRCLCEGGAVTDLWSYAQEHTAFVVRLGSLLAYSPRIGWAYVFAFDTSTYNALMGPTLPLFDEGLLGTVEEEKSVVPWYTTILYISFALLAPYLLLVYKVLWVWHLNRFSLSLLIGYALLHQLNDISNVFMFVFALRQRKTAEPIRVVQLFRKTFFGFHQLIPVVVTVASFILPTFVTYLFIYAFFMHFLFDCSVFVFGCVYSLLSRGSSRGEESEAGASNPKKDE